MILPGISGSFILLMLGQYEYLINVIHDFNLLVIFVFIVLVVVAGVICENARRDGSIDVLLRHGDE